MAKTTFTVPKARKLPSGAWFIQLRLGGASYSVTEATEADCIKAARRIKAEYQDGKLESRQAESRLSLCKGIEAYCEDRANGLSPATIRKYVNIKRNHWGDLMNRRMDQITKRQWQQAVDTMLARYAVGTVRRSLGMVKTVLRYCGVPVPQAVVGKASETKARTIDACQFLEPDQILRFVAAAAESKYCIPLLLALSSLRIAEIDGLDWANIDGSTVKVRCVRIQDKDGKWVFKEGAKTEASIRNVEIQIPALKAAIERERKSAGKVMRCGQEALRRNCAKVCAAAGVPNPGIHGLRHSFASLSAHLGIPEMISQEIGGWANERIMKEIYTHVARIDLQNSKDKLSAFYSQTASEPPDSRT